MEKQDLHSDHKAVVAGDDSSGISLRPLDLSDVDEFIDWYTDEKVAEFCPWDPFTTKEDAVNYVADVIIPHPWQRAICLKGKPVGSIFVTPFAGSDACRAEIGYFLGSKFWGKGIATRAVKMAAKSAFLEWPHLERIEGLVDVENIASLKVLLKAGFSKEGVLRKYWIMKGRTRDMVMFSLLSTDPEVI